MVSYRTLHDRVKALCKIYGVSIKELERECNIPKDSIYNWSTRLRPHISDVVAIAEYFDVSVDSLVR